MVEFGALPSLDTIHLGNVLEIMKGWPDGFISCIMTSPPYWALRKYRTEPVVWDCEDPGCAHEWSVVDVLRKASPGDVPSAKSILRVNRNGLDSHSFNQTDRMASLNVETRAKSILRTSNNGTGKSTLANAVRPLQPWETTGNGPGGNAHQAEKHRENSVLRGNNWSSAPWLNGAVLADGTPGAYKDTLDAKTRETSELRPGEPSGFCVKCGAWKGHLGLEPSPDLFVEHLCDIFDEVRRCMRDDGVCFVNIGDCYGGSGGAGGDWQHGKRDNEEKWKQPAHADEMGAFPSKCMNMIPERFALEMIRRGWILRDKIPWLKAITKFGHDAKGALTFETVGSCMPSSVTDRFTSCWEPVYVFTKSPRYWFERQFVPLREMQCTKKYGGNKAGTAGGYCNPQYSGAKEYDTSKLLGANMRGAWLVNTSKTTENHFATYPVDLCRVPIRAGCPREICTRCGQPRYPVVAAGGGGIGQSWHDHEDDLEKGMEQPHEICASSKRDSYKHTLAYTSCDCGAPFRPGIVFDPFMGRGTTAVAAIAEGRHWLGTELSPEYKRMAERRLRDVATELGTPEKKQLAKKAVAQKLQKLEAF